MKTAIKELSKIYDDLYEQGQKVIDTFNPCEVNNGKCASKDGNFCCSGCGYLGDAGCMTKSLGCKLWLCWNRRSAHKECGEQLDKINSLARTLGFRHGRLPKERTLEELKRQMRVGSIRKNIDRYRSECVRGS
ncbi:hypothetical protein LCGC14_1490550 [marine sediment metagenome]|uniref:Uncharacterized protein n=1 Tax=marine sediment metagenome TaxID=412755 RepID=A0A0F9LMD3_9ZZZZ